MKKEDIKLNNLKVANASSMAIKGSVQKINLVCKLVAKMKADHAMLQLQFLRKRLPKMLQMC